MNLIVLFKICLFYVLFSFTVNQTVYSQNYWIRHSSPTNQTLFKCIFTDTSYGWIAGDSGVILNTINSGANWNLQTTGLAWCEISDVFFLNRFSGWALGNDFTSIGTIFLTTSNGGMDWLNTRLPDSSQIFSSIYFTDSLTGFICGGTGSIFKTTNGGMNWNSCVLDTTHCFGYLFPKKDIIFVNQKTGYSCGGAIDYTGMVLRTTNGGQFWETYCIAPEPFNAFGVTPGGKVAAMGGDYDYGANITLSTDNGNSWSYNLTSCFGAATGFSFRTPAECWAVLSYSALIAVNIDSIKPGTVWQCLPSPENEILNDIIFTSNVSGWAVGTNGSIFKYNPLVIGIANNQNSLPQAYELYQNYPNPFNPITKITYSLPQSNLVVIRIFDIHGSEVAKLDEGLQQPGVNSIEFDGGNLSSGVYFYSIKAGNFMQSRKMVLIK